MSKSIKEITLKEIISGIQDWFKFLLKKWKIILICGVLGGIVGVVYATLKKKVYSATLTFAIEERSGGSMGMYAGIASQFGFDLGKGDGGVFTGDNILELMRSRNILEHTLLTEVEIDGKSDLLINRYLTFNGLYESWKNDDRYKNIIFTKGETKFSIQQDSVIGLLCTGIRKDLFVERIDKKISIVKVVYKSKDEIFAKLFTEVLAKNVSYFYVDIKTRKTRANVALLENRLDSVRTALDKELYGAAVSQDQNLNPSRSEVRVPTAKKQMNAQILTTLYGELIKNLEVSKLTLMREEPLIQVIDSPVLPLEYKKPGRLMSLILGGFVGGFLIVAFLVVRRLYQTIMSDVNSSQHTTNIN